MSEYLTWQWGLFVLIYVIPTSINLIFFVKMLRLNIIQDRERSQYSVAEVTVFKILFNFLLATFPIVSAITFIIEPLNIITNGISKLLHDPLVTRRAKDPRD